ncbi:alpha-E domain-containing protein [Ostreiculturibacter nitratireducens]|uniref:alpha-E domain-containing protein n=1 Tax=Ostreiculturibacter nitratireducens TaxID=3075226 RepID=UPI0031B645D0
MLGKTAGGLFWMYRYLERAENASRLIETGQRIALTRAGNSDDEWASVLRTAGVHDGYVQKHDKIAKETAIDWMLRDADNPSSVLASVEKARSNARLVRTALTHDVWEAVNGWYMDMKEALARKVGERDLPKVLGLIRQNHGLVRGATQGTMLRNDIYDFTRIGTFIERADNTGRILDVKYYVLLPTAFSVGSNLDNVQWETILRSVSGGGGFRMVYGQDSGPREIAQFLILDRRMPRSLNFCCSKVRDNLNFLSSDYARRLPSLDLAETISGRFQTHDIDAIFDYGLHEYIQDILSALRDLGRQIEIDYRFYE